MVGMSDCDDALMLQRGGDDDGLAAVIEGDQIHCKRDDVIRCLGGVKLRVESDDEERSRAIDGDQMHCSDGLHIGDVIGMISNRRYRIRRGHQSPWLKIAFLTVRLTVMSTRCNCRKTLAVYFCILGMHSCVTVNRRTNNSRSMYRLLIERRTKNER